MNPPLEVGRELPDADAIRARLDRLDEERALLRKLLHITLRIEGRQLLAAQSSREPGAVANAS